MALADIGHHADVRPGHLAQAVHLPKVADAHLHHGQLMLPADAQQGQGHADLIVEIALRLQDAVLFRQHGRDELLGAGLAHAAGDAYDFNGKLLPVGFGDVL